MVGEDGAEADEPDQEDGPGWFGTVGSEAITYSGSVSGSSMSGTWKLEAHGQVGGTGSWKASKSS